MQALKKSRNVNSIEDKHLEARSVIYNLQTGEKRVGTSKIKQKRKQKIRNDKSPEQMT